MAFQGSPIVHRVAAAVLELAVRQGSPAAAVGRTPRQGSSSVHRVAASVLGMATRRGSPVVMPGRTTLQESPAAVSGIAKRHGSPSLAGHKVGGRFSPLMSLGGSPVTQTPRNKKTNCLVKLLSQKKCDSSPRCAEASEMVAAVMSGSTQSPACRGRLIYNSGMRNHKSHQEIKSASTNRFRRHEGIQYFAESLIFSPDIDESPVFLSDVDGSTDSCKFKHRNNTVPEKLQKVLFPTTENDLKSPSQDSGYCKKQPHLFGLRDLENPEKSVFYEKMGIKRTDHLEVPPTNLKPVTPPTGSIPKLDTPFRRRLMSTGLDKIRHRVEIIGRGGFGVVITAAYENELAAVKVVRRWTNKVSIESLRREENVYSVDHVNVTRLLTMYHQDTRYGLVVMEYAGSRNLHQILDDTDQRFDRNRILGMAVQVASALRACHQQNIVHLDVKPSNIIVNHKDHCKLSDFGCSRRLNAAVDGRGEEWGFGGTVAYQAPELLRDPRSITDRCDTYSLGITLWQMMSRENPYDGMHPQVVIYKVAAMNLRPNCLDMLTQYPELILMIVRFWNSNPEDRPSSAQIVTSLSSMI